MIRWWGKSKLYLFPPLLVFALMTNASEEKRKTLNDGWQAKSRYHAHQWVGAWLISRDGEARYVWSLKPDGSGRSYAFLRRDGTMQFVFGYDINWYFDPFTQMANIKTERRIVCRQGKLYPYFLTLKSYESDYAVRGKFAWQTTWTEVSIGQNRLHKSFIVFVAPLSAWHDPESGAACPSFPPVRLEQDIDAELRRWDAEQDSSAVDVSPGTE
ncbi:hypothetical protein ACJJIF_15355 [Microbulbifer sp. SSSA002]|uniref:hypothetical protein n=1 Tax=Microbulbifer sp. SSSA002 TaxID=3243376 RepID=UPI004039D1EA